MRIAGILCRVLSMVAMVLFFGTMAQAAEKRIEDIIEDYGRSVVFVGVEGPSGQRIGSGFITDTDGLILTNAHIVSGAEKVYVKLKNKRAYAAAVLVTDTKHDIAILKIDAPALKAVKLGNSRNLDAGQRVVTIGHPLGLENTVSDGLVSAVRRLDGGLTLVQITVPLSPGSSGGPLFNMNGKVVGITTSSFDGGQNLNFAVPIHYAKALLRELEDRREYVQGPRQRVSSSLGALSVQKLAWQDRDADNTYTVRPQDTLYSISRRFNTTVQELTVLNDLPGPLIRTGQVLKIPHAQ